MRYALVGNRILFPDILSLGMDIGIFIYFAIGVGRHLYSAAILYCVDKQPGTTGYTGSGKENLFDFR